MAMADTVGVWSSNLDQTAQVGERPLEVVSQPLQQSTVAASMAAVNENSHTPSSTITPRNTASDVIETNFYNSNLEFYGLASSVAFLRHVETLSNCPLTGQVARPSEYSLASRLYNTDFQPDTSHQVSLAPSNTGLNSNHFYFRVARRFLDAYFSSIHHIQPLVDEDIFLARCEDLWFGRSSKQPLSFVALYYATLSLGSLVMPYETPGISDADRFMWSRKLYNEASVIMTRLGNTTDIEMVQCAYMMSKICQHELNPHVAYLYSGQAARISLAIGINRSPTGPDALNPRTSMTAAKTWWAVYCLDIQTSFALGRPDSLGRDEYHTQSLPTAALGDPLSTPHALQFVPCMIDLSRIMRKTSLDLYTQPCELRQKLNRAKALDIEVEHWLEKVPSHLRSESSGVSQPSLRPPRAPGYIKKQSVVLRLRYLNLRMVIHAIFMIDTETGEPEEPTLLQRSRLKCIQSAEETIDLIYSTFLTDDYFQTWWYNATYILYAVSILLAVVFRRLAETQQALENHFAHIDRAIVALQAMDDCLVARNATTIIKRTLARAKKVPQDALVPQQSSSSHAESFTRTLRNSVSMSLHTGYDDVDTLTQSNAMGGDDLGENVGDLDWLSTFDDNQALFWSSWAHEIDTLGA